MRPADGFRMSRVMDFHCLKKCHNRSHVLAHRHHGTGQISSPCRRVGWSRMALLLGRRSNTITRCHSSLCFFYCSLIIFTGVPFLLLKFYTVVATTLMYKYANFRIYWANVKYCHHAQHLFKLPFLV